MTVTGMFANEAGIICAGCDCDGPRAYGKTQRTKNRAYGEGTASSHAHTRPQSS